MAARLGDAVDEKAPDLLGQLGQLGAAEATEVGWALYLVEHAAANANGGWRRAVPLSARRAACRRRWARAGRWSAGCWSSRSWPRCRGAPRVCPSRTRR